MHAQHKHAKCFFFGDVVPKALHCSLDEPFFFPTGIAASAAVCGTTPTHHYSDTPCYTLHPLRTQYIIWLRLLYHNTLIQSFHGQYAALY